MSDVLERMERLEKENERLWRAIEDLQDTRSVEAFDADPDPVLIPDRVVELILDGLHPIAAWRTYRGLTQEQLASQAGTARSYLGQVEQQHDGRQAGVKLRGKLAKVLDCHPDALISD